MKDGGKSRTTKFFFNITNLIERGREAVKGLRTFVRVFSKPILKMLNKKRAKTF